MSHRRRVFLSILAGLVAMSASLMAHHAGSLYDRDHPVTIVGEVVSYEFINPHTRITIDVKDAQGNIVKWVAESAPPQRLYRAGWKTDTLKKGDKVTVVGSPMKDGSKFLSVRTLTGPDGKVLKQGAE